MNAIVPQTEQRRGPGRPKGSLSRVNGEILAQLQCKMKEIYGIDSYNPLVELARIANDVSNPLDIRAAAHAKIAPYVFAQLKQVEVTGADGGAIEVRTSLIDVISASLDHGDVG